MTEIQELVDRWLLGDALSERERIDLDRARREDPELDREMTELDRIDAWVGPPRERSDPESLARVWERIAPPEDTQAPEPSRPDQSPAAPVTPLWPRRKWLAAAGASAAAAAAGLFFVLSRPVGVKPDGPAYVLRVEGGERTVLGGELAVTPVLYPDSRLGLVLQPRQETELAGIEGVWRQGERTAQLSGGWTIAPSGAARLEGMRSELAPNWLGEVQLELLLTIGDTQHGLQRLFHFVVDED